VDVFLLALASWLLYKKISFLDVGT